MKRVTASEARRNWFRLLDEVAAGAVVVIERAGRRILVQREEKSGRGSELPDYASLLRVPDAERAHEWRWRWPGEEGELSPEGHSQAGTGEDADAAGEGGSAHGTDGPDRGNHP